MWLSKKNILTEFYVNHGLTEKYHYTPDENAVIANAVSDDIPLADEVYESLDWASNQGNGKYYSIKLTISPEDLLKYIGFKQIDLLSKIRGMLIFFVTITILGLVAGLLNIFSLSGYFR